MSSWIMQLQQLRHRRSSAAFTLVETLVVVAIIAMVVGLTAGVTGALNGNRGNAAAHQLTAVLDSARVKAMAGQGEIWVAFANHQVTPPAEAFRSYVICRSAGEVLQPISAWETLPAGHVFTIANPALAEAGINLMALGTVSRSQKKVRLTADPQSGVVNLPCLGFGSLGELVWPGASSGPILLSLAEGHADGPNPRSLQGTHHDPDMCRWISVQRNTGKAILVP